MLPWVIGFDDGNIGADMVVVCLLLISVPTNLAEQLLFILLIMYLSGECRFFLVWCGDDGGRQVAVPMVKFFYRSHFLLTDLIEKCVRPSPS